MSRVKTALVKELSQRFGVDCGPMVDFLYSKGTLDDVRVRMHVVKNEVVRRLVETDIDPTQIHEDVGNEYGLTRQRVQQIAGV